MKRRSTRTERSVNWLRRVSKVGFERDKYGTCIAVQFKGNPRFVQGNPYRNMRLKFQWIEETLTHNKILEIFFGMMLSSKCRLFLAHPSCEC